MRDVGETIAFRTEPNYSRRTLRDGLQAQCDRHSVPREVRPMATLVRDKNVDECSIPGFSTRRSVKKSRGCEVALQSWGILACRFEADTASLTRNSDSATPEMVLSWNGTWGVTRNLPPEIDGSSARWSRVPVLC